MLKMDLKRIRKQRKTSVRERFAYLLWNLQNLSKDLWRLEEKKLLIEDRKRLRICEGHAMFIVKLENMSATKIDS